MSTRRSGSSSRPEPVISIRSAAVVVGLAAIAAFMAIGCSAGTSGEAGRSGSEPPAIRSAAPSEPTGPAPETDRTTSEAPARTGTGPVSDATAEDQEDDRTTSTGETYPVGEAVWTACGGGLECSTVQVPLDHDRAAGETIELALIRAPALGEAVGSIFINFGGPGGSAVNSVRNGYRLDDQTMGRYHLVGFDPRGVGASAPLNCRVDLGRGPRPDSSPDTPAETARLDEEARALAEQCGRLDGPLLPHLGTDSVIRDLDLLRQAVGDSELNYVGFSYGTVIGLRYAERYPTLTGRMVVDGVVDPSFSLPDLLRQQAVEFERAFVVLDAACGSEIQCPSGGIAAEYDRLAAALERDGPQGEVGATELEVATLITMYSEQLWPRYARALIAAEQGDFTGIESLHDLYVGGVSFPAYLAVSCLDSRSPVGATGWNDLVAELQAIAPRFGAALGNEVRSCAYWPVPLANRPGSISGRGPVSAPGAGPILVLSTTGDAATPLVNAANVAAALVDSGLVIVDDEGHTAYGTNFCVERIVADYFATGEVPDGIHRC